MEKSIFETEKLSTGFKLSGGTSKTLHHELDLELRQGELICILGPNGSGKSTLLRTLLGFLKPLAGQVSINQKRTNEISIKEMAKLVSVVLTEKVDDFYLTAFEIALTGLYPHGSFSGRISKDDKLKVEQIFEQFKILHLLSSTFYKLSDGEKQKVMIARAIVQGTPFIFMDEPVAFIDSPGKVSIMHLVKELTQKYQKGVLMATHDIDAAVDNADQLWLLGRNSEFEAGLPNQLINSGSINRFFDQHDVSFNKQTKRFDWNG